MMHREQCLSGVDVSTGDDSEETCLAAALYFTKLFKNPEHYKKCSSKAAAQHAGADNNAEDPRFTNLMMALVFTPLRTLLRSGFCSHDTLTFALVIAQRLSKTEFIISWANCRRVLLSVVMLAGKIHADEYYSFSTLAPCVGMPATATTMTSLAKCEWKICVALDFALQCSVEEHTAVQVEAFAEL